MTALSRSDQVTGYLHPLYAAAFADLGQPLSLPRCGGWIVQRPIPGLPWHDAMGCYPFFACSDWRELHEDLRSCTAELVSLVLITDPFGPFERDELTACFPDLCRPFKQHFVVDLARPLESFVSPHHQRNIRKTAGEVAVEHCADPVRWLNEWQEMYCHLIQRHQIRGVTTFPGDSFAKQFAVPGLVAFRAHQNGETLGMLLWYVQRDVAYYHLGAYSPRGYECKASFGLFRHALEYLAAAGFRWAGLGAGAGATSDGSDGLTRFKRGWSTGVREVYLCGRVFDRPKYEAAAHSKRVGESTYFPAYRQGEFA